MKCRHCSIELEHVFMDLGYAPPSNAYLTAEELKTPEKYYPLKVLVCDQCWLVQTEDYTRAEDLFSADYAYFSSTSVGWLTHALSYSKEMINDLKLNEESFVIEVASNDGYLLKNFVSAGIPCLGIEPTASTAAVAENLGIPVLREFFSEQLGCELSSKGKQADLIVGNNVYAHVPDINNFTRGLKTVLKLGGTVTLEFPHVMRLIENTQFDTIYHEHFSYLSLYTVQRIFNVAGLRVYDVQELSTHGGSLRVLGCHSHDSRPTSKAVQAILTNEESLGLFSIDTYRSFQEAGNTVKNNILQFLLDKKRDQKTVVAYGAAAKGNTLLNYAGVKTDLLPVVFDAATAKQNKYMPGSHIPIKSPLFLDEIVVDFVLILPWNIAEEVKAQFAHLAGNGTQFVTAVPELRVI